LEESGGAVSTGFQEPWRCFSASVMPLYLVRLLSFEQFCPTLSFRLLVGFRRVRALFDFATAGILAQCDEKPQQNHPVKHNPGDWANGVGKSDRAVCAGDRSIGAYIFKE